jgi:hypothetical protein
MVSFTRGPHKPALLSATTAERYDMEPDEVGDRASTGMGIIREVARRLEGEQAVLTQRAEVEIFGQLASYANVPRAEVAVSIRRNIRRAINTLLTHTVPEAHVGGEAVTTTRERSNEGVPIEDILQAYRMSLRVIYDRFTQLADEINAPAAALECSNLLWQLGDWFTGAAAVEYQQAQFDSALLASVQRTDLIRELLRGALSTSEIDDAAATLDIPRNGRYRAFRMIDGHAATSSFPRLARSRTHFVVAGESSRSCVGFTGHTLDVGAPDTVGLGTDVTLDRLKESMQVADEITDVLRDGSITGVYDVPALSWRLAVAATPHVASYLHNRYVQPLLDMGEFGHVTLSSVRAYLAHDMNVRGASESLVVHRNTLRYRLAKYEEVTDTSFTTTGDLVEMVLALGLPIEPSTKP